MNTGSPSGSERTEYQFQPALDYDLTDMATSSTTCSTMSGGWERFREIENRSRKEAFYILYILFFLGENICLNSLHIL